MWPAKLKVIDTPLHKYLLSDGERRVKVVDAAHPDAMRSVTLVRTKGHACSTGAGASASGTPVNCSLLEVTIKTGRTHQIRVHLASSGHCIAGDDKYGDFEWNRALAKVGGKRMFLHAWRLQVKHPVTNNELTFVAPLSDDLKVMLTSFEPAVWAGY